MFPYPRESDPLGLVKNASSCLIDLLSELSLWSSYVFPVPTINSFFTISKDLSLFLSISLPRKSKPSMYVSFTLGSLSKELGLSTLTAVLNSLSRCLSFGYAIVV